MRIDLLSWFKKLTAIAGLSVALVSNVHATPTLTAAAVTAGFGLSQFADQFPSTGSCCGPLGIAFVGGGAVMVTDYPGNIRIFATDTDGQHATSFAPVVTPASYGSNNVTGLARLGNFVYMALQQTGSVVRLNLDGTFNSTVVTGLPTATGIVASTTNGKLYVSDCCSSTGIYVVDPVTNTKTVFKSGLGGFDGLSISADGHTLYAENGSQILGFDVATGVQVFASGVINGADGTELGAGTLAGKIFVNTNFGELWEVDIANPAVKTLLVSGGSRGDFVTADPNGTLLFTQTDSIWRLSPSAGGCIGAACNTVPEPSSVALVGIALLGLASRARRRQASLF